MNDRTIPGSTHTAHMTVKPNRASGGFVGALWILPKALNKSGDPLFQQEFATESAAWLTLESRARAELAARV